MPAHAPRRHPKVSDVPELLALWHPTRNEMDPAKVSSGSKKHAWWRCVNGHEFTTSIVVRCSRIWCPSCVKAAKPKVAEIEWLMELWHPTRNEALDSRTLTLGS